MKCKNCEVEMNWKLICTCRDIEQDMINTPPHYTKWGIEHIDYIISNKMNFCEWACIKYITRYKHKNWLEDLKKARFYIDKLIDWIWENK